MLDFDAYRAHEALVAPARAKGQLWRLLMGLVLIAGTFLMANQFLHDTLVTLLGPEAYGRLIGLDGEATQAAVIFLLLSFGLMTLATIVALRVAHQRGFLEVLGDLALLRHQFLSVLILLVMLNGVVLILPPWGVGGGQLQVNVGLGAWLLVLPFAVLAILVQVSAEEILFRGYLQQQLAARFATPLVWLVVPSILFGLGHYMPTEAGANAMHIAIWATVFGLLMADLTARAGTLGPAIAVHFVNNFVAILLIALPDSLSGLALYLTPFDLTDTEAVRAWLPVDFAMMVVSWLAARLAIRR